MLGWIKCLLGFHAQYSWSEDHNYYSPPEGHDCRPRPGDPASLTAWRFAEWTRIRCRRCTWTYPR